GGMGGGGVGPPVRGGGEGGARDVDLHCSPCRAAAYSRRAARTRSRMADEDPVTNPRYSVLLPTRQGASLLEACVRSVLDQPYEQMELVVSDNNSDDGTAEILAGLAGDPRLRVVTQTETLRVTDNWNAALAASSGDLIVLLGDDDLLLDGYFERADELRERHGEPEVLLYNGYAFAFPGFEG